MVGRNAGHFHIGMAILLGRSADTEVTGLKFFRRRATVIVVQNLLITSSLNLTARTFSFDDA